jgi:hypothetical protein
MTLRMRMLGHIGAALACIPACSWAQADALKHDPFARPALSKPAQPAVQPRDAGNVGRGGPPERVWKPELTAVVVAGPRSMVSIDGTVLHIGEEIDGHRLVEVHEHGAVFIKNRKRVTLTLAGMRDPGAPAMKDERVGPDRPEAAQKQDGQPKVDARGTPERRDDRKREEK